ncbi:MAG: hypothetical protein U0556_00680 [Dehalococcoidia bacterium]
MTNQPPTRATERITRRKELRQSRILEAQRRRTNRTRLIVGLVVLVVVLVGLGIWLGVSFLTPPVAGLIDVVMPVVEPVTARFVEPTDLQGSQGAGPWLVFWS